MPPGDATVVDRRRYDDALHEARVAAYPPGEFVGQESFLTASGILALARQAGVTSDTDVLDLCCGVGGPGLLLTRELGCRYRGTDRDDSAVRLARERAGSLACRFDVAAVPPLPPGDVDVVLLLETVLAFPDKAVLLSAVAERLRPGGRFACTLEEGAPLTPAERLAMPASDTVQLTPLPAFVRDLAAAGLKVTWCADVTPAHRRTALSLARAFVVRERQLADALGASVAEDLVRSHLLWCEWLSTGRVRKFELVSARARPAGARPVGPSR